MKRSTKNAVGLTTAAALLTLATACGDDAEDVDPLELKDAKPPAGLKVAKKDLLAAPTDSVSHPRHRIRAAGLIGVHVDDIYDLELDLSDGKGLYAAGEKLQYGRLRPDGGTVADTTLVGQKKFNTRPGRKEPLSAELETATSGAAGECELTVDLGDNVEQPRLEVKSGGWQPAHDKGADVLDLKTIGDAEVWIKAKTKVTEKGKVVNKDLESPLVAVKTTFVRKPTLNKDGSPNPDWYQISVFAQQSVPLKTTADVVLLDNEGLPYLDKSDPEKPKPLQFKAQKQLCSQRWISKKAWEEVLAPRWGVPVKAFSLSDTQQPTEPGTREEITAAGSRTDDRHRQMRSAVAPTAPANVHTSVNWNSYALDPNQPAEVPVPRWYQREGVAQAVEQGRLGLAGAEQGVTLGSKWEADGVSASDLSPEVTMGEDLARDPSVSARGLSRERFAPVL
jgi:hypothetical protein